MVAGLGVAAAYVLIWMFNGKRSHSLIAVLATVCACYITRLSGLWPVLFTTAFAGALVVAHRHRLAERPRPRAIRSPGSSDFLGDFQVSRILESLNVTDGEEEHQRTRPTNTAGSSS